MAATAGTGAVPGAILGRIEGVAWRVPLPTRRLVVVLAVGVAGSLAGSGIVAAWVTSRHAGTIAEARASGLGVADAAADFHTRLATYDADAAAILVTDGVEDAELRAPFGDGAYEAARGRAGYDGDLARAAQVLAEVGLVAEEADEADLRTLTDRLVRYTGVVETARANAAQGNPVAAAYLDQARHIAQEDLMATAAHLRRSGEQRVARAANDVGGPIGAVAVASLVLALVVLLAASVLVAGRTRRLVHPALLAAAAMAGTALVLVAAGFWTQTRVLQAAATEDVEDFVTANETAFELTDLRITEIAAVVAGGDESDYSRFATGARRLSERIPDRPDRAELQRALCNYRIDVQRAVRGSETVAGCEPDEACDPDGTDGTDGTDDPEETDEACDPDESFRLANSVAVDHVQRTTTALRERIDAADAATVEPGMPLVLGLGGAVSGAGGILARGRRYR